MMDRDNGMDFTIRARKSFYKVVDSRYFMDKDADLIYDSLEERLKLVTFGEYLRRYIYQKEGMTVPFEEVPVKEYQRIISDSFSRTGTPKSFTPSTAKLSALCKNWLTQQTVKRNIVFLLGFGLAMNVDEVNTFLMKGLREQRINPKNPFEVICWYCYKFGLDYKDYERLWREYEDIKANSMDIMMLYEDLTLGVRNTMQLIKDEETLMAHLCKLKTDENITLLSVSAKKHFLQLYDKARDCVVRSYNELAVYDKLDRVYTREDITEADLEHVICAAIPVDRHGNLTPAKASSLNTAFAGRRFSRQRVHDILTNKSEVNRFDLITLNFFIFSQSLEEYRNPKSRYTAFIESMNKILSECSLGQLYIANPYENFILMCILAEDPLVTYADVWEMSY